MKTQYHIIVDTTDQHMAGTDSNIFIVLYGEHGTSDEIRINSIFKGNAFERNHLDEGDFYVNEDYGDIHKIRAKRRGRRAQLCPRQNGQRSGLPLDQKHIERGHACRSCKQDELRVHNLYHRNTHERQRRCTVCARYIR